MKLREQIRNAFAIILVGAIIVLHEKCDVFLASGFDAIRVIESTELAQDVYGVFYWLFCLFVDVHRWKSLSIEFSECRFDRWS